LAVTVIHAFLTQFGFIVTQIFTRIGSFTQTFYACIDGAEIAVIALIIGNTRYAQIICAFFACLITVFALCTGGLAHRAVTAAVFIAKREITELFTVAVDVIETLSIVFTRQTRRALSVILITELSGTRIDRLTTHAGTFVDNAG